MTDLLALVTIILWPIVPLFWIPVHGLSRIFKRLGILTYALPLITWIPIVYLIYINKSFLLQFKTDFPFMLNLAGILLLITGTILHFWTGKLLGILGLMGLPEVSSRIKSKLVSEGPFSLVRHPTYLAHTLMFSGIFLITGVTAVGILTLLDFLIVNFIIIPLEERELLIRFGNDYKKYKQKVRYRFFPGLF
jgi:protein-S-isoprenylcysteine O-methyltransferase Ste14